MYRVRCLSVLVLTLVVGTACLAVAQDQAQERSRRGRGLSRGSLLGLLRLDQVQDELKLEEDQVAKVRKIGEELSAEMREQYAALREIDDRQQQREKMTELRDQFDNKAREQLRDVLAREQMMRLYQIRLQVRSVVDSLANRYVVGRLKITDEQKEKLAQINKEAETKMIELYGTMRAASEEQRSAAYRKFREIRDAANEKAIEMLNDEQAKAFEEMKGEKIELEMRRGR